MRNVLVCSGIGALTAYTYLEWGCVWVKYEWNLGGQLWQYGFFRASKKHTVIGQNILSAIGKCRLTDKSAAIGSSSCISTMPVGSTAKFAMNIAFE